MRRTLPDPLRKFTLLAPFGVLLAGCASLAPSFETPALPVAPRYAIEGASQASDAASIGWRDYFTDPALQAVIARALDNNRDLRTAVLRVDEARAAYAIQRSTRFPNVGLQGDGARTRVPGDLNPLGQSSVTNQFQLAVGMASWEIDFWGAVKNRNEAALQSYLATDAARRAVTLALIAQVADSYLGLREIDERIALARQTVATRQESVRIYTRRYEVGSSSRLTLIEVQTLLTQAQALLAQLMQAQATQAHALTLLVGAPVELPPTVARLDPRRAPAELRAGLPSDLLLNRPDIVAAEHQLRASYANIGAARAAFFPRVALTGSFGTASNELDRLFAPGTQAWTFAPGISLPLLDWGARDANLEVTRTRRELALAAYDKTVQSAFRDVADALSARHWLNEQLDIAETALAEQTERARLAQLRFDSGATTFLEVLDAQRNLLAVEQQVVQLRRALLASRVALYTALGGGSLTLPDDMAVPARPDTPSASRQ